MVKVDCFISCIVIAHIACERKLTMANAKGRRPDSLNEFVENYRVSWSRIICFFAILVCDGNVYERNVNSSVSFSESSRIIAKLDDGAFLYRCYQSPMLSIIVRSRKTSSDNIRLRMQFMISRIKATSDFFVLAFALKLIFPRNYNYN